MNKRSRSIYSNLKQIIGNEENVSTCAKDRKKVFVPHFHRMHYKPWQKFINENLLSTIEKRGNSNQILPFPRLG